MVVRKRLAFFAACVSLLLCLAIIRGLEDVVILSLAA